MSDARPEPLGRHRAELRGDLETIVATALAKDRAQRYASARALAEDLRRWRAQLPILARRPSTWYQLARFAQRNRALVAGLIATLVVLCLGLAATTWLAVQSAHNEHIAQRHAYAARLTQALALARTDPLGAEELLELTPPEFRSFEWHYTRAQVDEHTRAVPQRFAAGMPWHHQCAIAYHRDGRPLYAVTRGDTLALIDLSTDTVVHRLAGGGGVIRPAFSGDGSHVAAWAAAGSAGATLRVWNTTTAESVLELALAAQPTSPLALSDDGRHAAFATADRTLALVDVTSAAMVTTARLPAATEPPTEPTFMAGDRVAYGGGRFDLHSGALVGRSGVQDRLWQLTRTAGGITATSALAPAAGRAARRGLA